MTGKTRTTTRTPPKECPASLAAEEKGQVQCTYPPISFGVSHMLSIISSIAAMDRRTIPQSLKWQASMLSRSSSTTP